MNVKVQNQILNSESLNWFQGKVQNDILVMPHFMRHPASVFLDSYFRGMTNRVKGLLIYYTGFLFARE
jgi:hypothetical protein